MASQWTDVYLLKTVSCIYVFTAIIVVELKTIMQRFLKRTILILKASLYLSLQSVQKKDIHL